MLIRRALCTSAAASEVNVIVDNIAKWVATSVAPNVAKWEKEGAFPRSLYKEAADVGLLQLGYPEHLGGYPAALDTVVRAWWPLCRLGCGGLFAGLGSHSIALPLIVKLGSPHQQQQIVPPVLAGDRIAALGITEPTGGSDVAGLQTIAEVHGDHFVVNGTKCFITSGMRANHITLAVQTVRNGAKTGVSVLAVDTSLPGISRTALDKQGWHCSDTALIVFNDVKVPIECLIGKEGAGFKGIMVNFNQERIMLAVQALASAEACLAEAQEWATSRKTFGKRLVEHQVVAHKLVDMHTAVDSGKCMLHSVIQDIVHGQQPVARICMLKNYAVHVVERVSCEAMQILGGHGYMTGTVSERVYREVKVLAIGGGATEVMKDLAARQLGLVGRSAA